MIKHQFNEQGRHRLEIDNEAGEWEMYEHPARHKKGYVAFSQYYGDKEKVFKIISEENVITESICNTCLQPTGYNGKTMPATVCQHQKDRFPTLIEGYVDPQQILRDIHKE